MGPRVSPTRAWLIVLIGAIGLSLLFSALHISGAALLGGIVAAATVAVVLRFSGKMPAAPSLLSKVILGVTIGALVNPESLSAIGTNAVGVTGVLVATIAASVVAGKVLSRFTGVDEATSQMGMIAGGASGVVAMSDDTGADARLVALMQYIRVYLVIAALPLAALVLPDEASAVGPGQAAAHSGSVAIGLGLTAACMLVVLLLGRVVNIAAGTLLIPMLAAAVLSLWAPDHVPDLPDLVRNLALLVIGLQIGLQFTLDSLRMARRLLPLVLGLMVGLIAACAGLGLVLASVTGRSPLDGYLATTPGGLIAVLGVALDKNVDTAFITSIQVIRLLVMMLMGPLFAAWLGRRARAPEAPR